MVLEYVQQVIGHKLGIETWHEIGPDFSFMEESRVNDEVLIEILEQVENEMEVQLVDYSWKFETLQHLVDFIIRYI